MHERARRHRCPRDPCSRNPSGSVTRFGYEHGLPATDVSDVLVDVDGTAWLAFTTQVGVSRLLATWDPDEDGDGVPWPGDDCPFVADPDQADIDGDRVGDACELP